jgi:hypothetical protein
MVSRSKDLTAKIVKEAKNSHKKRKRGSEPKMERRNRKDVYIDQYGVDQWHKQSGGGHDMEEKGKRDRKGALFRCSMKSMVHP